MADIKPGTGTSAIVPFGGKIRGLDAKSEPEEIVTPERLDDKERVAGWLRSLLRDAAALKRRWAPKRIDFQDYLFDATGGGLTPTLYRFEHGFNGRVRWSVVEWRGASAGPQFVEHYEANAPNGGVGTNNAVLVLRSFVIGTGTIRIEQAG